MDCSPHLHVEKLRQGACGLSEIIQLSTAGKNRGLAIQVTRSCAAPQPRHARLDTHTHTRTHRHVHRHAPHTHMHTHASLPGL